MFIFNYLLVAALAVHCSMGFLWQGWASCGEGGLLLSQSEGAQASHCGGFSCCRAQALGLMGFSSCGVGLVSLQHVESSWARIQTHVPSIGRRVLNHWTTRRVPESLSFNSTG